MYFASFYKGATRLWIQDFFTGVVIKHIWDQLFVVEGFSLYIYIRQCSGRCILHWWTD